MSIRPLALALLICFALPTASALAQPGDPVLDSQEHAFCKQINTYRAQNGLSALKVSVSLTTASKWMSADMARNDYFDHTDSLDRSFMNRTSDFGYTGTSRGENIAAGSAGGIAAFNQWKHSAPHKAIMLTSSYKVIGIGRAYNAGSAMGWYWTADFGNSADRTMAC